MAKLPKQQFALYTSGQGKLIKGDSIELLKKDFAKNLKNKVNLILTSPAGA